VSVDGHADDAVETALRVEPASHRLEQPRWVDAIVVGERNDVRFEV
jgi:hypothetical protein